MAKIKKDSIIFYRSFYESLKPLPNKSKFSAICAIIEYALDGTIPKGLDSYASLAFGMAKPVLDTTKNRYAACVENGKKGGRPRKVKTQEKSEEKPDEKTKNNQTGFDKENLNEDIEEDENVYEDVYEDKEDEKEDEKNEAFSVRAGKTLTLGEYKNIFLTGTEVAKLIGTLGHERYTKSVEFLSGYLARKPGYKSANHFEDIRSWVQKALIDRGIMPTEEQVEKQEKLKKAGFDIEFEDIFERG